MGYMDFDMVYLSASNPDIPNYTYDIDFVSKRELKYIQAVGYLIENEVSLRAVEKECLGVSRSALSRFINDELGGISIEMYDLARRILRVNKLERNNFKRFPRPEPHWRMANIVGSNWM